MVIYYSLYNVSELLSDILEHLWGFQTRGCNTDLCVSDRFIERPEQNISLEDFQNFLIEHQKVRYAFFHFIAQSKWAVTVFTH